MKKKILSASLIIMCLLALCSCRGKEQSIYGTWTTESIGYITETTFKTDGTFHSCYRISDEEISLQSGITQEILDSMETESFYRLVPESEMTMEEKKQANGNKMIKTYATKEKMETDTDGYISYYNIEGDKLTINGCIYTKNK